MTGFARLVRLDATVQWRSGIVGAVAAATAVWAIALAQASPAARRTLVPVAVYIDAGIVGFMFVGGHVLLDRRDRVLAALGVSPATPAAYVTALVTTLTAVAVVATAVIAVSAPPAGPTRPLLLLPAVVGLSVPVLLCGVLVAARVTDVTRYVLAAQIPVVPAVVPLLSFTGWLPSWAGAAVPTDAPLQLLAAASGAPVPWVRVLLGGVYTAVTAALLWRAAVTRVGALLREGG